LTSVRRVERAENNVAVGDFIQNAVLVVSLDTSGFMSPLSPTSQSSSATDPPSFQIDPDIRTAQTPPSVLYHEPAYVAHQKDTVFARSWHLVGDTRELKATGSVKPFTLLEGGSTSRSSSSATRSKPSAACRTCAPIAATSSWRAKGTCPVPRSSDAL